MNYVKINEVVLLYGYLKVGLEFEGVSVCILRNGEGCFWGGNER